MILELIDYCLYIVPPSGDYVFRPGPLFNHLEDLAYKYYNYNVEVMKSLIDCGFLTQELLLADRCNLYSGIMLHIM